MNLAPALPDAGGEVPRPLAVDLDDTLIRTDTLFEAIVELATRRPLALVGAVTALGRGRAAFKRAISTAASIDFASLPYDHEVLALIRARSAAGGEVYLVTAADQHVADGVAAHLGLFDGVIGSDGSHNLKAANKAVMLAARFPGGFDYIGDSVADLAVWGRARDIFVAGSSAAVRSGLARRGLHPAISLARPAATAMTWARALRLHQWSKNALLLVPLLLGQEYSDPQLVAGSLAGFVVFGFVASATYLLNDMSDLAADRAHPTKCRRALASGLIALPRAIIVMMLLLAAGLAGAFALDAAFGLVTLAYLIVTLTYSYRLKAQPLLDVLTIGGLFAIRIEAGTALTAQPSSLWLTSFTMILFTSLALAKRHGELVRAAVAGRRVAGRGYLATDAPMTIALGIASATMSVFVMLLYMQLEAMQTDLYRNGASLFLIPIVLTSWLMRVWVRAHRGTLHDDPVNFALRDRVSLLHAAAVGGLWCVAVF